MYITTGLVACLLVSLLLLWGFHRVEQSLEKKRHIKHTNNDWAKYVVLNPGQETNKTTPP